MGLPHKFKDGVNEEASGVQVTENDEYLEALINALYEPGDVKPTARAAAPAGWLLCEGQQVSRVAFANLFAAIGVTYGAGDGATTFNLPDGRGRTLIGAGTAVGAAGATAHALGSKGGEETHALTAAENGPHAHGVTDPGHAHGVTDPGHAHAEKPADILNVGGAGVEVNAAAGTGFPMRYESASTGVAGTGVSIQGAGTGISIQAQGEGAGHNNMQPYLTVNWLIKY